MVVGRGSTTNARGTRRVGDGPLGGSRAGRLGVPLVACLPAVLGLALVARPASAEDVFSYRASNGVLHFTNVPTDRRFRSFAPPAQRVTRLSLRDDSRASSRWARLRVGREMREMISETAYRFDLEPALVHAVVRAESGFNPRAVSSAGARGLMQLMPSTAIEVGVRDVFHPQENLEGGVSYLRGLIDRYEGNVHLALAAYNAGPGAVETYGGVPPYAETQEYLRRVFRFRQEYLHDSLRERDRAGTAGRVSLR